MIQLRIIPTKKKINECSRGTGHIVAVIHPEYPRMSTPGHLYCANLVYIKKNKTIWLKDDSSDLRPQTKNHSFI